MRHCLHPAPEWGRKEPFGVGSMWCHEILQWGSSFKKVGILQGFYASTVKAFRPALTARSCILRAASSREVDSR